MMKASAVIWLLVLALAGSARAGADKQALQDPNALKEQAPASFQVKFETTKGNFVVSVTRDWAPVGADRFYNLVKHGYYDDLRFFRVVPGFVVQFGMSGDPALSRLWQVALLKDDPVKEKNTKGRVTFAKTAQPHSRTTQVFINLKDNSGLDAQGFAPFGEVSEGMDVVEKLYGGYGDGPNAPNQGLITRDGNAYLDGKFPQLDKLVKATIVGGGAAKSDKPKQP